MESQRLSELYTDLTRTSSEPDPAERELQFLKILPRFTTACQMAVRCGEGAAVEAWWDVLGTREKFAAMVSLQSPQVSAHRLRVLRMLLAAARVLVRNEEFPEQAAQALYATGGTALPEGVTTEYWGPLLRYLSNGSVGASSCSVAVAFPLALHKLSRTGKGKTFALMAQWVVETEPGPGNGVFLHPDFLLLRHVGDMDFWESIRSGIGFVLDGKTAPVQDIWVRLLPVDSDDEGLLREVVSLRGPSTGGALALALHQAIYHESPVPLPPRPCAVSFRIKDGDACGDVGGLTDKILACALWRFDTLIISADPPPMEVSLAAQRGHIKLLPARKIKDAIQYYEASSATTTIQPATVSQPILPLDPQERERLLLVLRAKWIDGVLKKSLAYQARLAVNMEKQPEAVDHPGKKESRRAGTADTAIPEGKPIYDVYVEHQRQMLILGMPGAGKTTTMLELMEQLLQNSEADLAAPVPIKLDLSTWQKEDRFLQSWLIAQFAQEFTIGKERAKQLIESGGLVFLLDGLDEVAESHRASCVNAINEFLRNHPKILQPLVICCRTREYKAIPNLRLNGAVVIKPLTEQEIDAYLLRVGRPLAGLRKVLEDEKRLYENEPDSARSEEVSLYRFFNTPLNLNVAALTYADPSGTEPSIPRSLEELSIPRSVEERRRILWDAYIAKMLERKSDDNPKYNTETAIRWLEWLGKHLARKSQTSFLIERLQPDDLSYRWGAFAVRSAYALPISLGSFFLLLSYYAKPEGWIPALMFALLFFFPLYSREIILDPIRRIKPERLRTHWRSMLRLFQRCSFISIVAGMVVGGIQAGYAGIVGGGVAGATTTLFSLFFATYRSMFDDEFIDNPTRPNEGIFHSLKVMYSGVLRGTNTVLVFIVSFGAAIAIFVLQVLLMSFVVVSLPGLSRDQYFFTFFVIFGVLSLIASGSYYGARSPFLLVFGGCAMFAGFAFADPADTGRNLLCNAALFLLTISAAVKGGLRTVAQHALLRLLLGRSGCFPYKIVPFLDWATARILLQRTGGSWQFVHLTLRDHLAERYDAHHQPESRSQAR